MSDEPDTGPEAAPEAAPETADMHPAGALDIPPDRLAISPKSEFFDADLLRRGIGIRFKGAVRTNVEEYCISEGWIRVQAGKSMDRKGQPLTIKLNGPVEAWFEDLGDNPPTARL